MKAVLSVIGLVYQLDKLIADADASGRPKMTCTVQVH
jgi:hypothetical protein